MTVGRRSLAVLLILGCSLIPAATFGHSTEFILAKVTPRPGRVEVELTADYGGNPMLASVDEARAVLSKILRVKFGDRVSDLVSEAPLHFEERTKFDPTAPIPTDPTTGAEAHHLLCAFWSAKCPASKVTFVMPSDAGQSMILWTTPESPGKPPRWVFLLPGETSPEIPILPAPVWPWWVAGASLAALGLFVLLIRLRNRRRKESDSLPA